MAPLNQYHPQTVPHPGMDLGEKLVEMNMGPKEFGVRTGKPEKTIIAVIKGESSITPDMAVQFENALGIPARYWIQRQRDHDECLARERHLEPRIFRLAEFGPELQRQRPDRRHLEDEL